MGYVLYMNTSKSVISGSRRVEILAQIRGLTLILMRFNENELTCGRFFDFDQTSDQYPLKSYRFITIFEPKQPLTLLWKEDAPTNENNSCSSVS